MLLPHLINRVTALVISLVGSLLFMAEGHFLSLWIASLGLIIFSVINVAEGIRTGRCKTSFGYSVALSDSPFLFRLMMTCWAFLVIATAIFSFVILAEWKSSS